MSTARALLLLAALCACASATPPLPEASSAPASCSVDAVEAQAPCLRCACAGNALVCSHRACAPLPALAPGCRVLTHPGLCCPHVDCPGGVVIDTELDAGSDGHNSSLAASVSANSLAHACREDGRTYLSGSAMAGGAACAECFCVRGGRRCVAPRCLPPPPHCVPRPAPGLCCPDSYSCSHPDPVASAPARQPYDCIVKGRTVAEGSRVPSAARCSQCFCLRGAVRCGALDCARALPGCAPVVPDGHCCALRYNCSHTHSHDIALSDSSGLSQNALTAAVAEKDRSFRSVESSESTAAPSKEERTNKVKRKTEETAPVISSTPSTSTTHESITTEKASEEITTEKVSEETTTASSPETSIASDQIAGSMKIMINGTINCTTSISSSNMPMNSSREKAETENQSKATQAAVAMVALGDDDIITERELESFTVRVTSAMHAALPAPSAPAPPAAPAPAHNASEDYDYDYVEPTLPPSLPNLKIIPFVAADAVVDKEVVPLKEPFPGLYEPLQSLEREDQFPVYYAPQPAPAPAPAPAHAQRRHDAPPPPPRPAAAPPRKPAGSMFSPPIETEGGFVPKAPGLSGEYFAVYPPRPGPPPPRPDPSPPRPGPPAPRPATAMHLTTSMQLGTVKDDMISLTTPRPPATTTSTTTAEQPTTVELLASMTLDKGSSPAPLATPSEIHDNHESKETDSTAPATTVTERATPSVTAAISTTSLPAVTTTAAPSSTLPPQYNGSLEYEEEEEDEGFSFGSVLKLLLSESYDSPPAPPPPRPTVAPFVPLPPRPAPPRKTASPQATGVNRIDHLVLGEAAAIRRPAPPTPATPLAAPPATRPATHGPEPPVSSSPPPVTRRPLPAPAPPPVTRRPLPPPTRRPESTTKRVQTSPPRVMSAADTGGPVPGGLKLAGCNIYGRMYRVGRIIAELSGACQECRCTDTGVQCRALPC